MTHRIGLAVRFSLTEFHVITSITPELSTQQFITNTDADQNTDEVQQFTKDKTKTVEFDSSFTNST